MKAYKGFDQDLQCRDFQYEVGKTYIHEGDVVLCKSGFHACLDPLDTFQYYNPGTSRYFEVEVLGWVDDEEGDDSKVVARSLTLIKELSIEELIGDSVENSASNSRPRGAASNSGDYGAASNSGDYGATSNSGTYGVASNSGTCGAASNSGDYGAASNSGHKGKVKGVDGSALFLLERSDTGKILATWAGIVGEDNVKANQWYMLVNGKLEEV